jgi:membrane protein implicated in regulation of membrane protease activity
MNFPSKITNLFSIKPKADTCITGKSNKSNGLSTNVDGLDLGSAKNGKSKFVKMAAYIRKLPLPAKLTLSGAGLSIMALAGYGLYAAIPHIAALGVAMAASPAAPVIGITAAATLVVVLGCMGIAKLRKAHKANKAMKQAQAEQEAVKAAKAERFEDYKEWVQTTGTIQYTDEQIQAGFDAQELQMSGALA